MNKDKQQNELNELLYNSNAVSGNMSSPIKNGEKYHSIPATNTSNRMYGGYNQIRSMNTVNFMQVLEKLNSYASMTNTNDLFAAVHDTLSSMFNCAFVAMGIFHAKSKCINLRLADRIGSNYSSRIFLSDEKNPIIESFNSQEIITCENSSFLNLSYVNNCPVAIMPMISVKKCIGVFIVATEKLNTNLEFFNFMSKCIGLYAHNIELVNKFNENDNTDSLTSLLNHRGFQEVLSAEIEKSVDKKLSVVIFDVNNISKINRELGHAKGDEVIKLVAEKVKQNIRNSDVAGRYGGDEIAVILPNTNTDEAKYMAEYLTYSLSCCFVDDVGPVKVSVGISTYPDCSTNQEKLLILAEQAMYVSQSKGYKDGMSAIISSTDFNFWDDMALHSFAEIITKRHAQLGVNFEEELLTKFNAEEIHSHNHLSEMATSLAGAIDAKDPYTKGHSTSVSRYSEALARAINLPEHEVQRITLGALLHDVGKIGIPENVLKKPSNLSEEEWEIMKQHPVIGAEKVLMPNEALRHLIPIVKYHHERWDGKGYPEGLKGNNIPLEARIVSVADAYHALISDRPYRKGLGVEKACEILSMGAGIQWDRDLIRQFIQIAPSLSTKI